jgi:hypothetical protein
MIVWLSSEGYLFVFLCFAGRFCTLAVTKQRKEDWYKTCHFMEFSFNHMTKNNES